MPPIAEGLIAGIVAGISAPLVAWATVKVHLHYIRRDMNRLEGRVESLESQRFGHPYRRKSDRGAGP